jgi:iron complex transport system ATP-binding protein
LGLLVVAAFLISLFIGRCPTPPLMPPRYLVQDELAQAAQIMRLDEPTLHLDLSNQSRVLHIMAELAGRGITIVFTTHDPTAAAAIADYMFMLRDGQTLAAGPTAEVITSANLTAVYNTPVHVHQIEDRLVALAPIAR